MVMFVQGHIKPQIILILYIQIDRESFKDHSHNGGKIYSSGRTTPEHEVIFTAGVFVHFSLSLSPQVQDAFRCRLRNCQDPMSADATGTFPNGHAQIMVSIPTEHNTQDTQNNTPQHSVVLQ